MFTSENAAKYGSKGGSVPREGFKQQAQRWVRENGFERAIDWINGIDGEKEVPWPQRQFAMGLLFSYALGRPAEKIQIDDRKEVYVNLASDPALNAIAARFGILPGRVREIENGSLVDGEPKIQAESTPTHGI